MTTLAKRATPSQARILRIIAGAVLNAADAHGIARDEQMARSIAKRATGTLTAQWPEVLAANTRPPKTGSADAKCRACERRRRIASERARRERVASVPGAAADNWFSAALGAAPSYFSRRRPLLELWTRLRREMWTIRRSGDQVKFDAYVHLLRMIDKLHRDLIAAEL